MEFSRDGSFSCGWDGRANKVNATRLSTTAPRRSSTSNRGCGFKREKEGCERLRARGAPGRADQARAAASGALE
eukprot:scaffold133291_cov31-Tisochrysis_lutea.AAC.9